MLKQKIANTNLFAEYEKVDILAHLDEYSDSDKKVLEEVIDQYDAKHKEILKRFRERVTREVDDLAIKSSSNPATLDALHKIKQGIGAITSDS